MCKKPGKSMNLGFFLNMLVSGKPFWSIFEQVRVFKGYFGAYVIVEGKDRYLGEDVPVSILVREEQSLF